MPDEQRPRHRFSLRLRLTLWVVAIFAIIRLSLGLVILLYQRASVNSFFDTRLLSSAQSVADEIGAWTPDIDDTFVRYASDQIDTVIFGRLTVMVFDEDGRLLASDRRPAPPIEESLVRSTLESRRRRVEYLSPDSVMEPVVGIHEARVALLPFEGVDGRWYALVMAAADTYARQILARSTFILLATFPTGLLAAAISGWFIGGIAVAPIQRLREAAKRLSPESIESSVQFESAHVEVDRLEQELNAARERIAAAFRSQERFMSNVSHELKTPIAVVLTEAQVLNTDGASDEVREFVGSVREELQRASDMIESFLLLTRVREGRSVRDIQRCGVNDLIIESIDDCRSWASQNDVRITPDLLSDDDSVDTAVYGDPNLLRTMLSNLILNAIRFSPAGESVDVTARVEHGVVWISVRDRGPGIPEKIIDRIFDRFVQADGEQKRGRGHGLGLEIAQGIAELHGGSIRAQNMDTSGCQFTIWIPASRPAGSERGNGPA